MSERTITYSVMESRANFKTPQQIGDEHIGDYIKIDGNRYIVTSCENTEFNKIQGKLTITFVLRN